MLSLQTAAEGVDERKKSPTNYIIRVSAYVHACAIIIVLSITLVCCISCSCERRSQQPAASRLSAAAHTLVQQYGHTHKAGGARTSKEYASHAGKVHAVALLSV
jgi:hypothetical protein